MPPQQSPLTFATGAPKRGHAKGVLTTVLAGEKVQLHADRALYWPRERTLFIADVHLGKAATFRAGGVPLPSGVTATDLGRLTALVERADARRIVVLGDLLHARSGRVALLDAAFREWRRAHAALQVTLVRGNHDAHAGDPPREWDIECTGDPYALPPFLACHEPATPPTGYALCGHLHPGVRLSGIGEETARLPCFVLGPRHAILPAFGRFTGLAIVAPAPTETIVAIAGTRLFTLPRVAERA